MKKNGILGVLISGLSTAALGSGSFAQTCEGMALKHGNILEARCEDRRQELWDTQLELRGVENIYGHLKQNSTREPSSFALTCRKISIDDHGILHAECAKKRGVWNETALDLNQLIENINGTMVYWYDKD